MIFLMDYMPGVTKYLFWNAGLKALRKLSIDDCPTLIPLPLPKETFGIVETKVRSIMK